MGIKRLQKRIPDILQRVKTLSETGQVKRFEECYFKEGVFVDRKSGELKGILGFDTEIELVLKYNVEPNGKVERFTLPRHTRYKVLHSNYELAEHPEHFEINTEMRSPLELRVKADTNHLQDPAYQGVYHYGAGKEDRDHSKIALEILKGIGVERVENPVEFTEDSMIKILDHIRDQYIYMLGHTTGIEELVEKGAGQCQNMAELFECLVYYAGGQSMSVNATTLNEELCGYPYFSLCKEATTTHALSGVHINGYWVLVDPTIYNTTYNNAAICKGVERRAYNQAIRDLQIIEVQNVAGNYKSIQPPMLFSLDRLTSLSESALCRKILTGIEKPDLPEQTHPTIDARSIKIIN